LEQVPAVKEISRAPTWTLSVPERERMKKVSSIAPMTQRLRKVSVMTFH
jgi:hypothetical protein